MPAETEPRPLDVHPDWVPVSELEGVGVAWDPPQLRGLRVYVPGFVFEPGLRSGHIVRAEIDLALIEWDADLALPRRWCRIARLWTDKDAGLDGEAL